MASGWAAHQFAEFLARPPAHPDERTAISGALQWTAEAMEAEVAAIVHDEEVIACLGYAVGQVPSSCLLSVAASGEGQVPVPPGIEWPALVVPLDGVLKGGHLLLARVDDGWFSREEINQVKALARILTLT